MYEMLINIILIHISIFFFLIFIFFNYKQKTDFFVTNQTTKFMKFLKYNIDSQSLVLLNVGIINI